jgi:hypothetical protein
MDYSGPIGTRGNVRADRPDPVEEEEFKAILEATRLALYFDHGRVLVNPGIKD